MAKRRDRQQLYETAIHEAGHAVACIHTRAMFTQVTIRRRGDIAGEVICAPYAARRMVWRGMPRETMGRRLVRGAIIAMAGISAEMQYAPEERRDFICHKSLITGESDVSSVNRKVEIFVEYGFVDRSEEAKNRTIQELAIVTADIIDGYWPSVIALADALMETPTIGYRRARRIIMEAQP